MTLRLLPFLLLSIALTACSSSAADDRETSAPEPTTTTPTTETTAQSSPSSDQVNSSGLPQPLPQPWDGVLLLDSDQADADVDAILAGGVLIEPAGADIITMGLPPIKIFPLRLDEAGQYLWVQVAHGYGGCSLPQRADAIIDGDSVTLDITRGPLEGPGMSCTQAGTGGWGVIIDVPGGVSGTTVNWLRCEPSPSDDCTEHLAGDAIPQVRSWLAGCTPRPPLGDDPHPYIRDRIELCDDTSLEADYHGLLNQYLGQLADY